MSILILLILIEKFNQSRQSRKNDLARTYLLQKYFDGLDVKNPVSTRYFVDAFIDIETQIVLEPDIRMQIINDFKQSRFINNMRKNLKSFCSYKRKEAIHYLSLFKDETTILRLKKQFNKEKDASVRFYLLHALKADNSKHLNAYTRIFSVVIKLVALFRLVWHWIVVLFDC